MSWQRSWLGYYGFALLCTQFPSQQRQPQESAYLAPWVAAVSKALGIHSGLAAQHACTQQVAVHLPANDSLLPVLQVGVTAMLIASKYEEIWAPEVRDFVYISDKAYSREQILNMEKLMLNTLRFKLTVPTPWNFLSRSLKVGRSSSILRLTYHSLKVYSSSRGYCKQLLLLKVSRVLLSAKSSCGQCSSERAAQQPSAIDVSSLRDQCSGLVLTARCCLPLQLSPAGSLHSI